MIKTLTDNMRRVPTTAAAIAFAAAASLAGPATAQDDTESAWQQVCTDAWDDAPASEYCPATVTRIASTATTDAGQCTITASCSATANLVGGGTQAFTVAPGWMNLPPSETDDVTLCWSIDGDEYDMNISASKCKDDEIDLSTATGTGLPPISVEDPAPSS
jgi:hypothetical protein